MDCTIVTTKFGKVKGNVVELAVGPKVDVFRNVPLAKPPTGARRFMPPELVDPWNGTLDATKPGNLPMYDASMDSFFEKLVPSAEGEDDFPRINDEDCLHTSIYTPNSRGQKKLAVMVWFYGGGFHMGTERDYNGSILAGMNDVVVVVPNYRVGIFGFLSFGPGSVCTGNAGLLDQQHALKWVRDNIEQFGGDRNNITIFGESAGAASVHLNVLSPTARGLFHRAISHSGQQHLVGMFQDEEQRAYVHNLTFEHCKIESQSDADKLKALQSLTAEELLEVAAAVGAKKAFFSPTVDGKVLPKRSGDLMEEKQFPEVPYIIGCNTTEGDGLLSMLTPGFNEGFTEEQSKQALMVPVTDAGFELLKKRYLREEDGAMKFSRFSGRISGDALIASGAVDSAVAHSETGADTYFYLGGFKLKLFHDDTYGDLMKKPEWCECDHGDDIPITFGVPFAPKLALNAKFTVEEKKMCKLFMTYLTNFAKTGNPNEGVPVELQWPKYQPGGEHLLVNTTMSVGKNYGMEMRKFWTQDMKPHRKAIFD